MSDAVVKYTAEVYLNDLKDPPVSLAWTLQYPGTPVPVIRQTPTVFRGEGESPEKALQGLVDALETERAKHGKRHLLVDEALRRIGS